MKDIYRIILVDDEDEVRGRISSNISDDSGFRVAGTAGNGYDALDLIEKDLPHVVLTDIKMPYIDGIELARIIRRDYPTIRIAFITGFDEFDYAREAVELHASSYLTKPVTKEDISGFLKKLKAELDKEFTENQNIELLRIKYEESIPYIINMYFCSCLVSSGLGQEKEIENLRGYGVRLDETFILAFVKPERPESLSDVIEYEKLKLSSQAVLGKTLEKYSYSYYHFMFNDGIILVIKTGRNDYLRKMDHALFEMVSVMEKYHSIRIDIGVSNAHESFPELNEAYREAEEAIHYGRFMKGGKIIYFSQIDGTRPGRIRLSGSEMQRISRSLRFDSDEEFTDLFRKMRNEVLEHAAGNADFRIYILKLANIVIEFSDSAGIDVNEMINGDFLERINKFRNLESALDWIREIMLNVRSRNYNRKKTNSDLLLEKVISYIDANYSDHTISMEKACDLTGISVSYLSLLFKKQKDTTFTKYLTLVRLEKAKELLKLTGDRIIEIAEKCGYSDVYYFSHSFKKNLGVSPKKYREENYT